MKTIMLSRLTALALALLWSTPWVDSQSPVPDWQVAGYFAAIQDRSDVFSVAINYSLAKQLIAAFDDVQRDSLIKIATSHVLNEDSVFVSHSAVRALEYVGSTSAAHAAQTIDILARTSYDDPSLQIAVTRSLAAIISVSPRYAHRVIDPLKQLLSGDAPVRIAAVNGFTSVVTVSPDYASLVIDLLTPLVADDAPSVRQAAIRALAAAASRAPEYATRVIDFGITLLGDDDWRVSESAAHALGNIAASVPKHAHLTIDPLISLSHISDGWTNRIAAAQALVSAVAASPDIAPSTSSTLGIFVSLSRKRARSIYDDEVMVLEAIGSMFPEYADEIIELLSDLLVSRYSAPYDDVARALGTIGATSPAHAQRIIDLLIPLLDRDPTSVPEAAAEAIHSIVSMTPISAEYVLEAVSSLLEDGSRHLPHGAPLALKFIGTTLPHYADRIIAILVPLLQADDIVVREYSARALAEMISMYHEHVGAHGLESVIPLLEDGLLLRYEYGQELIHALTSVSEGSADQVFELATSLFSDDSSWVREGAVLAMRTVAATRPEYVAQIAESLAPLLNDEHRDVRVAAARVLRSMGVPLPSQRVDLVVRAIAERFAEAPQDPFRHSTNPDDAPPGSLNRSINNSDLLRDRAADGESPYQRPLLELGPHEMQIVFPLYGRYFDLHRNKPEILARMRFWSLLLTAPTAETLNATRCLLDWLHEDAQEEAISPCEELPMAFLIDNLQGPHERYYSMRQSLETRLVNYSMELGCDELVLIEDIRKGLQDHSRRAVASQKLRSCRQNQFTLPKRIVGGMAGIHMIFWTLLLTFYRRSPAVQATFFWNKLIRRIAGAGYVGFLLAHVPQLRRLIFYPFREHLLADAELEELPPDAGHYPHVKVERRDTCEVLSIDDLAREREVVIIIEGKSGSGKTWCLRRMARDLWPESSGHKASRRCGQPVGVFLEARRCENGVIEAIGERLAGTVADYVFLEKVIHGRGMVIIIDGLNEVSAETRARITRFAERPSRASLMLATQPMQWESPKPAQTYRVRPLEEDCLAAFLKARITSLQAMGESTSITDLESVVQEFLDSATGGGGTSDEERKRNLDILSSPMQLSLIGEILARGERPDLHKLMIQYYEIMSNDYRWKNQGSKFPEHDFGKLIYCMLKREEPTLRGDKFRNELDVMAKHRMVVAVHRLSEEGGSTRFWRFRHDQVRDFFVAHAFLGEHDRFPDEHMGDARFYGVYYWLSWLLRWDKAMDLRERLINFSAETKDHYVSDMVVQNIRARKQDGDHAPTPE